MKRKVKLFWMLPLLIFVFYVDISAQELDKRDVNQAYQVDALSCSIESHLRTLLGN